MHAPWSMLVENGDRRASERKKGEKEEEEITRHRGDEISWPCHGEALYIPYLLSLPPFLSLSHRPQPFHFLSLLLSFPLVPPSLFLLSVSFFTTRMNIFPSSAASSSDRMEESSETGAISAEIESQNGENDCECFLPSPPLPEEGRGGEKIEGER